MLYKFKSQVSSDLIMLEPHGRRVLQIVGKTPGEPGIFLPNQMQAAIAALQAAVHEETQYQEQAIAQAKAIGEPIPRFESISLRQRSLPLIDLLQRCHAADVDLIWEV